MVIGTNSGVCESDSGVIENVTKIIDDYEDGDISEYTGDTGDASVTTATVYEGTYALEVNNAGSNPEIQSKSGLPHYPQRGETFETYLYPDDPDETVIVTRFGLADTDNHYRFSWQGRGNDEFRVGVYSGGSFTEIDGTTVDVSLYNNEWLRFEVQWGDPTITVTAYNSGGDTIATISGNDTTFDSGGISMRVGASSSASGSTYWDYWRAIFSAF